MMFLSRKRIIAFGCSTRHKIELVERWYVILNFQVATQILKQSLVLNICMPVTRNHIQQTFSTVKILKSFKSNNNETMIKLVHDYLP